MHNGPAEGVIGFVLNASALLHVRRLCGLGLTVSSAVFETMRT